MLVAVGLLPAGVQAQATTVSMVKDINTTLRAGQEGSPDNLVRVGSKIFFTAKSLLHGSELWVTDGTVLGTEFLKDINPGTASSNISELTAVGSSVYFSARDVTHGVELWMSDGTTAGTKMVKDIRLGTGSSFPRSLCTMNGKLFFTASGSATGAELWTSDGTAANTFILKDVIPGLVGSSPVQLTVVTNSTTSVSTLFFATGSSAVTHDQTVLWKSNGTTEGTVALKDFYLSGSRGRDSRIRELTASGSTLFFQARDTTANGRELWKSDGTAASTVLVKDIATGSEDSSPFELTDVNGTLFFVASSLSTVLSRATRELWKSDGTATGTVMVKDIAPNRSRDYPRFLTAIGSELYFQATDGINGYELWKSNGLDTGTVMIKDIRTGLGSSVPQDMTAMGGKVYFVAFTIENGRELWCTNGTPGGTFLVKDIRPGSIDSRPGSLTAYNGSMLLFSADDGVTGRELWMTDGTTQGTLLFKDLQLPVVNVGSNPSSISEGPNGKTFFTVRSQSQFGQTEHWVTDGTSAGTLALANLSTSSSSIGIRDQVIFKGKSYFGAYDAVTGHELWESDGTNAGTKIFKDLVGGPGSSSPNSFVVSGDTIFFVATDPTHGRALWKSDGTTAGTVLLKDPDSTYRYNRLSELTAAGNGKIFLTVYDRASGTELWASDGTTAGTNMVKDIAAGPSSSSPSGLIVVGSKVFFGARSLTGSVWSIDVWVSDGTAQGTIIVHRTGTVFASIVRSSVGLGGKLYFRGRDATHGRELWCSDGTLAGTALVKDIYQGSGNSGIDHMVVAGNTIFFRARGDAGIAVSDKGLELWKSDGTAAGTMLVLDAYPGPVSSQPTDIVAMGNKVYYQANDGVHFAEPWSSDGTSAGTRMMADISSSQPGGPFGFFGAGPLLFTASHGRVFFTADDGLHGRELWVTEASAAGTVDPTLSTIETNATVISACTGKTGATITVVPKDSSGNDLGTGLTVTITATGGAFSGPVTDNADGSYSRVLGGSLVAGSVTVSASVGAVNLTSTATIKLVGVDPDNALVVLSNTHTVKDGTVCITVTPKGCIGNNLGAGHRVQISTTVGAMAGTVRDNLDGTYSQQLNATAIGTAEITFVVDDLPLNVSGSLMILDPANLGRVIGMDETYVLHSYMSIQQAINASIADKLDVIFIASGVWEEKIKIEGKKSRPIQLQGLAATQPVTVREIEINKIDGVMLKSLIIAPGSKGEGGLEIEKSKAIRVICCTITGNKQEHEGVEIKEESQVTFEDCWIHHNGGDGIEIDQKSQVSVLRCKIEDNGTNGVKIGKGARVLISSSTIQRNGTLGKTEKGYGVKTKVHWDSSTSTNQWDAKLVTLVKNIIKNNRGKVVTGRSDANVANYDMIIDSTDVQSPYN